MVYGRDTLNSESKSTPISSLSGPDDTGFRTRYGFFRLNNNNNNGIYFESNKHLQIGSSYEIAKNMCMQCNIK